MKNMQYLTGLILAAVVLLAGCSSNSADFNEKTFLAKMETGGFLPKEIIDNLPDYANLTNSLGVPFDYWSKKDDNGNVLQKIELKAPEGKITRYHYKAYNFSAAPVEKLTLAQGKELGLKFIETFRPDLSALSWSQGQWYLSIYDPGNVEAWVAQDETHKYGVMVDLKSGLVEYFSQEDK